MFMRLKAFIGVIILALGIGGVFYWELVGREALVYTDVAVLNVDVQKNTFITEEMIDIVKMDDSILVENAITFDRSTGTLSADLIGKEAMHFIPKGLQLVPGYFDDPELVKNENEFVFKVPSDWIKSMPSTVRRKDLVYVYPVIEQLPNAEPLSTASLTTNTYIKKAELDKLKFVVAYVKDNANKEVVSTSTQERIDATGNVSELNVVVTLEQVELLKKYRNQGFTFVVLNNE